ncbi:uncharacterized protein [Primulina huaijiensis]|uniref:uncharacterized protein isoform X2 n=1 Tax=Primulina huaijiensis TaxID=1492673 RepID=UPI003CC7652F
MDSGGSSSGGSHNVIPESVMEAVRRTSRNVEDVEANLEEFLSYCDTETLSHLEHLERANVLLMIAKANTTLFALRLRCKGVDPDDHSIKREFRLFDLQQPLIPKQLPALLIIHCLIFLEKQSMREVIQGESRRINYLERNIQKKRKYQAPEKQSVRSEAQEFLEKASRELLGDNNVTKGPLQFQSEDPEDES